MTKHLICNSTVRPQADLSEVSTRERRWCIRTVRMLSWRARVALVATLVRRILCSGSHQQAKGAKLEKIAVKSAASPQLTAIPLRCFIDTYLGSDTALVISSSILSSNNFVGGSLLICLIPWPFSLVFPAKTKRKGCLCRGRSSEADIYRKVR